MIRHSARIVIVGGGFSGLGVAIRLLDEGIDDFVILEKADELGGTWRDNTYPGCTCDVPSHLYSFSFAPNTEWDRVFAQQAEIWAYLLKVARDRGLERYVRFDTHVDDARWNEADAVWEVETSQGRYVANVLVAGAGPLHEPRLPDVPGLDRFEGTQFHSARWRHDHDLRGRRVAVVGTGSSSIQFVPEIQPDVDKMVVFQRTAPWVLPKPDHVYPPLEKALFRHLPGFRRAYRSGIYALLELVQQAERRPKVMQRLQRFGIAHLRRQVPDPELRRRLTPEFVLGCKRLLLSNDWYPALQAPNVSLVHGGVAGLTADGVVGDDGVEHKVDTIIFGTGFHATDPPIADHVVGRHGETLAEAWRGSPKAYLGTTVEGFPNLFLMIGPNLGNGHTSALVLIEAQAKYIAQAVRHMRRDGLASVEVRREVQTRYNASVQEALAGTVWNAGGCQSWYLDKNGVNSSIYPWSTVDLRRRLSRFDAERYHLRARAAAVRQDRRPVGKIDLHGAVVAVTGGARGIGLATATAFAEAGAVVCIADLDGGAAKEAALALGGHGYEVDVTRRASFAAFIDTVEADVGPIDVLVNNAGVMPSGPFLEEPDEAWAAVMGVNVGGLALGMKLVLPRMQERGRGHVVNIASLAGRLVVAGLASYVASKHAAVGLSGAVREELEGSGVTLTTIMPGAVHTRLSQGIPLRGTFAIEPDEVAQAVLKSVRTRAPEVIVPWALGAIPLAMTLLPRAVMSRFRRYVSADRVMTSRDTELRAGYEADLARQGAPRTASKKAARGRA